MSETNHTESFKCPACGAPIEIKVVGERTVKCPFCGEPAPIPDNLLTSNNQQIGGVSQIPLASGLGAAVEMAMIMKLVKQGNKLEAIKLYRQQFPVSLRDAKQAVEQIERNLAITQTGQPLMMSMNMAQPTMAIPVNNPINRRGSNAGCILAIFIIMITLGIIAAVFYSVNQQLSAATKIDVSSLQQSVKATIMANVPTTPTRLPSTRAVTATPSYAVAQITVGKEGNAPGQFTNANHLGIDGKGNVYVGEFTGGRVQVFDSKGKYLSQFFSSTPQSELDGLAVDYKGNVYTCDGTVIMKYNGLTGEKLGQLAYPGGPGFGELAISPDGGVGALWYPTGADGLRGKPESFVHFDVSGKVTLVISAPISSRTGELEHTNSIAYDTAGNVYLASYVSSAVFVFGPDAPAGKFINRFGSPGSAPDQVNMAYSMAIDSNNQVYIKDAQGVIIFGKGGRFIRRIPLDRVRGFAFDGQDDLWAIEGTVLKKYVLGR